ncbi:Transposase DDE domain-containing protein [Loktanella sp. DSM 29012]|nr:Transposase DDE domain-containing protein [Loktanella sp. DSM 29012]
MQTPNLPAMRALRPAWNNGRIVGQKRPLKLKHVWAIRVRLELADTKLHAVTDVRGRPIRFFMTAGQVSDYTGARALLSSLPTADWLLGDRGYDADWFREGLIDKKITPCIPGRKSRDKPVKYPSRDIAAQYPAGQRTSAATKSATESKSCSDV